MKKGHLHLWNVEIMSGLCLRWRREISNWWKGSEWIYSHNIFTTFYCAISGVHDWQLPMNRYWHLHSLHIPSVKCGSTTMSIKDLQFKISNYHSTGIEWSDLSGDCEGSNWSNTLGMMKDPSFIHIAWCMVYMEEAKVLTKVSNHFFPIF